MKKTLHRRNSLLLFMVVVSMVLMAACDSTPATPVPGPTATTAQVAAPTATTAQSSNSAAPTATTAANIPPPTVIKGPALSSAKAGNTIPVTRSEPKGQLATHSLTAGSRDAGLNALEARNTATPVAQATPTEEVATQTGQAPEDWSIVLDSDFSEGDSGTWLTGDGGNISSNIEDGKLVMTASDGSGFYNWADETSNWDDGYISATVELDGPGLVGLSARVSKIDDNFYDVVCVIGNTGSYGCYREVDGQNENVGSGRSSAIKKNAVNELALLGVGEDFTFFINGKKVKSFKGEDVTEGSWGTYVESPAGETTSGAFSRILFIGPGGDVDEPTPEPDEATATPEPDEATATTEPDEATPTRTVAPVDENVIVSTDFSEDGGTWLTGEGDTFTVAVQDGELVVASTTAGGVVATAPDEAMDLTDARIEATFRIEETSADDPGLVGLSARSQEFATGFEDWSQVFCGINNSGAYSCNRLTQTDEGIEFKEMLHGQTDAINDGEANTIALTSKGSRWTFEINGSKVGSFTDNSQKHGAWGVLVESVGDSTTGFFSKISIFDR